MRSRGVTYRGVGTGGGTQAGISDKDPSDLDQEAERMLVFNTRAALEGRCRCAACNGVGKIAGSTCWRCKGNGWEPTPAELKAEAEAKAKAIAKAEARAKAKAAQEAEVKATQGAEAEAEAPVER